jgi:hypothetical protein
VFFLVTAAALLSWYAKRGVNNPFAAAKSIRVYGEGSGWAVAAVAAGFGKEAAAVGEIAVSEGALRALPSADSTGAATWNEVCPFADDGVRAVLLAYGGAAALVCDTAVYAQKGAVSVKFYEKLDMLVVPPSSIDGELLDLRNRFRPRFVVVAPPCKDAPAKNIICGQLDEAGRFNYNFNIKNGKLEFSED